MCFYLKNQNDNFKIADKDIICFKIVRKTDRSNIFKSNSLGFKYIIGVKYSNISFLVKKEIKEVKDCKVIEQGYHSFSILTTSANIVLARDKDYYRCVVKCIIPIGSMYYENDETKEYVSNQIIIKEIL